MELKTTTQLLSLEGKPLQENKTPLTLKNILVGILLAQKKGDDLPDSDASKRARLRLALAINNQDVIEVSVDDLTTITTSVKAAGLLPLIHGQVMDLLDGKETGIVPVED